MVLKSFYIKKYILVGFLHVGSELHVCIWHGKKYVWHFVSQRDVHVLHESGWWCNRHGNITNLAVADHRRETWQHEDASLFAFYWRIDNKILSWYICVHMPLYILVILLEVLHVVLIVAIHMLCSVLS